MLVVSLAGTTVMCCTGMLLFPSNAPELQHPHPAAPPRPLSHLQVAHHRNEAPLPDSSSLSARSESSKAKGRDGKGGGGCHRGNNKTTAPKTVGCEVAMGTGKRLHSADHVLLFLPRPRSPADRSGRVEMELSREANCRKRKCERCCDGVVSVQHQYPS